MKATKKDTSKKKEKPEKENLGVLDLGSEIILALPLPKCTRSLIVRYDALIRISCVIPSRKYTIHVSKGRIEARHSAKQAIKRMEQKTIKAPSLILAHDYLEVPSFGNLASINGGASLYAYHNRCKDKSIIMGAPYLISNVHASGHICFGSMNPVTPREAFNTFWNSPFNAELLGEHEEYDEECEYDYGNASDYIDEYHDTVYQLQPWEDITEDICGKKTWGCPKAADAILVSSNRRLLLKIPRKFWRKYKDSAFVVARGRIGKKHWNFESGGFKFKLSHPNITFKAGDRIRSRFR